MDLNKFTDGVKRRLSKWGFFYDDSNRDKKVVLVASMGRSGSTWISNLINHKNNYRIIFEPFNYERVKETSEFNYPLYLRENEHYPHYQKVVGDILNGKIKSAWVDRENRQFFPEARLIKTIRGNLFLKWLKNNFPDIKIVLLFRNPCAVINSWNNMNFGDGRKPLRRLNEQKEFLEDFGEYFKYFRNEDSSFYRLLFFWAYYYWVPLQQFNKSNIHLVFYENLFWNREEEISSLFQFLNEEYNTKAMNKKVMRPSSTTRNDGGSQRKNYLHAWKKNIGKEEIWKAYEILKSFGMGDIYDIENSKPNKEIAYRILEEYR